VNGPAADLDPEQLAALARVHADATALYRAQLHSRTSGGAAARALLVARGVPAGTAHGFGLGYAPAGWTALTDHLRTRGHPDTRLLAAGVSLPSRSGRLVDRFRDRLMFPVHDPTGRHVLGFLGRLLTTQPDGSADPAAGPAAPGSGVTGSAPKYLNSPHTDLYRKAEVLYGLGAAPTRQALAAGAVPVLVEGPLDAIAVTASAAPGFVGVAPCGTALTAGQVAVLRAYTGPLEQRGVSTAFDHDPAGRHAAARAFTLLRAAGAAWPTAATLPAGLDPAELARRDGPAALASALRAAGPLADLAVDEQLAAWTDRLHWAEGRIGAARAAARLLAGFPPEHLARQVHRLATHLELTHEQVTGTVLDALTQHPPAGRTSSPTDRTVGPYPPARPRTSSSPPPPLPSTAGQLARAGYPAPCPSTGTRSVDPRAGPTTAAGQPTATTARLRR